MRVVFVVFLQNVSLMDIWTILRATHTWSDGAGCYQCLVCFCSFSLFLCPFESRVPACRKHHRRPSLFWQMFRQTVRHTALRPKTILSLSKGLHVSWWVVFTSLAEFMSTAQACKSHLLPTNTIGTSSASFTRLICSRYVPEISICLRIRDTAQGHALLTYILETFGTIYSKYQQKSFPGAHILQENKIVSSPWFLSKKSFHLTWSRMAEYSSWPESRHCEAKWLVLCLISNHLELLTGCIQNI